MKKIKIKKIITWIIVPIMISIFALDILTVVLGNEYAKRYEITQEKFDYSIGDDRIHFLNTANSDAILIESNGKFALVDSGEGNNNPRRKTEYKGYEQEVIDYIKKVCVNDNGEVYLDFILGTHYHYDHVGCYHAILSDNEIGIGKAYFKKFDEAFTHDYEIEKWKLDEIAAQIMSDLASRQIEVVNDLPDKPFEFGDFTVQFYNTVTPEELAGEGENAPSVGVKLIKNGKSAFLASDITKSTGLEDIIGPQVGDIDLLKVGHHGYFGSSSKSFLKALSPEIGIVTNQLGKVYPNIKWNFTMVAKFPFYATYNNNGIIATFTDSDEIVLTNNIH